jgi:hypothetical protein
MKKEENEEEEEEEGEREESFSTILKVEDYDWSDITPIKQDDGPDPVVMIAYQEECELYIRVEKTVVNQIHL